MKSGSTPTESIRPFEYNEQTNYSRQEVEEQKEEVVVDMENVDVKASTSRIELDEEDQKQH